MEIREIVEDKYYKQIIDELRKEYGVKKKGDTYMSEERLNQTYNKYKNSELKLVGLFDERELTAFSSYQMTPEGLYGGDILVFSNYRGNGYGSVIVNYLLKLAENNGCKQMYFGARRSANAFYYKLGFDGVCLIQSSVASKEDIESILNKHKIENWEYNLYQNTVHQFRIDARFINNQELVNDLDNTELDIVCILTFSKSTSKQQLENNIKK